MNFVETPEPRGRENARAPVHPPSTSAGGVIHSKADVSLVALAQFHERLRGQHVECGRAFASLQAQVTEAICAQQKALAALSGRRCSPGPLYYRAASDAVRAANVLFRYLFEGLFAHQLDACQDLARGLERAARGRAASPADAEAVAAAAELQEALYVLRQVPERVQRAQRELLPEMPLIVGPPSAAPSPRGSSTASHPLPFGGERASGEGAAGARQPPAVEPSRFAVRPRRVFAVSAAYSAEERGVIAELVKRTCRCGVVVLPQNSEEAEEAAAVRAGCCCLVTEKASPQRQALSPLGSPRSIVHTSMEHLREYFKSRIVPPRQGETATAATLQEEEDSASTAVLPPGAVSAALEGNVGDSAKGSSPMRHPFLSPDRSPHALAPPPDKAIGEADNDEDNDEDAELTALLEMLDEAAHQQLSLTSPALSVASPLLSQSPLSHPSLTQQVTTIAAAVAEGAPGGGNADGLLAGDGTTASPFDERSPSLRGLGRLDDELSHRSAVAKRPRSYFVEKASASLSEALHADEERRLPPRWPRRREPSPDSRDSVAVADDEEDGEEAVIPSQSPPLSVMESQTVRYQHIGRPAGDRWPTTLVAVTDPSNELERALVARRPPPRHWLFQVSNSCKERRKQIVEAIRRLGSEVDTANLYHPEATHLVVAEGITERTEKYLSSCAAGKFVVPPRYVFESARRGHWLLGRMSEYNTNPLRRFVGGAAGTVAARRPFAGWHVLLVVSHPSVASGIRTVLTAGGCDDVQAFICNGEDNNRNDGDDDDGDDGGEQQRLQRRGSADGAPPSIQLNASAKPGDTPKENDVGKEKAGPRVVGRSPDGATDGLTSTTVFAEELLSGCSQILVECLTMSCRPGNAGNFLLPPWIPRSLMRPELYPRLFTLELLYYCLCTSPVAVFDEEGRLLGEERLTPACRVEPFQTDAG